MTRHRDRWGTLDVTRAAAAFSVVALHSFSAILRSPLSAPYASLIQPLEASTRWAIPFFFAAAGLLAGRSKHHGAGHWLKRRVSRLAIPLAIWSAVCLAIVYPERMWQLPPLGFAEWIVFDSAFGHLWFLQTLLECTVLLWLMQRFRVPDWATVAGAGALFLWAEWALYAGRLPAGWSTTRWYYQFPLWLAFYASGLLVGRLKRGVPARAPHEHPAAVGLGVTAAGLLAGFGGGMAAYRLLPPAAQLPAVLAIAAVVGVGIALYSAGRPAPTSARWSELSSLSMGIYLLHLPIQHYFERYVPVPPTPAGITGWVIAIFAVSYVGSLGLSWLLTGSPVAVRLLFGQDIAPAARPEPVSEAA